MKLTEPTAPTTVVIVGHVDHGKSTFIGRFLYDTGNLAAEKIADLKSTSEQLGQKMEFAHVMDQFREEREKNITIDTSQTFFNIKGQNYIFVDAPGHKEYLKNMITGATQAKNAILLLDISEGIKEQTDKHVKILKLLGISRLAVLVNKLDKVKYRESEFQTIEKQITDLLNHHKIGIQHIIPISAYEGDNVCAKSKNMLWYKGPTALEFVVSLEEKIDINRERLELRIPIQLVHEINGETLLLGRIESGLAMNGQTIQVFPKGEKRKIKKVLKYEEKVKQAKAGESVSLVLDDNSGVQRGSILCGGDDPSRPVRQIKTHVFWAASSPLKCNDEINVECRTQKARFKILSVQEEISGQSSNQLQGGDIGLVELSTSDSILLQNGGSHDPFSRIVFHRDNEVVGCGIIEEKKLVS